MVKKLQLENHRKFILLVFVILLKFLLVRTILFENNSVVYTIFVEIGYLLLVFGLIEMLPFKKTKSFLYFFLNLILSILLLIVLVYHNYFGNIVTIHAFSLINQVGAVKDSVLQLINPIYLILFVDFIILAVFKLFKRNSTLVDSKHINFKFLVPVIFIGISFVSFHIINQKGNFIPNTVVAAEKQGILTYELLATMEMFTSIDVLASSDQESSRLRKEISELKQLETIPEEDLRLNGIAKDKNIIAIQAESFQNLALNLVVDGKEITPFLNELLKESIYFPNTYQQVGPGNTSDAEFLFNTSSYPGDREPASELYGDRAIPSLPKLLKEENYTTLTFHANDVNFWNRTDLYPALGFDKYYDIAFFGNEDIIGIGPSDDYVYKKALPELKKLYNKNERFYAQFITLSNHRPFTIPEGKQVIDLPERFNDTLVGDYLKSLYYTDWALKEFVNDLKEAGMWDDTVLVFYGDHFGVQPDGLEEENSILFEELVGHEYTFLDQFNIPFFISLPGENISEVNETISGQIDMMPTLANLLGLSLDNFVHFGQDVINYPDNLLGNRYYMPYGSFFNHDIVFSPNEGFEDGEALNIRTQEQVENFSKYEEDYQRVLNLLKLSDDYKNSLPLRDEEV